MRVLTVLILQEKLAMVVICWVQCLVLRLNQIADFDALGG